MSWPGAYCFDPERFARGTGNCLPTCSYIPFAAEPRAYLSSTPSMIQGVLLTAQMLTRFEVAFSSCADGKTGGARVQRPSEPA